MGTYNGYVDLLDENGGVIDRAEASLTSSEDRAAWRGSLNSQPGSLTPWKTGPVRLRLPTGEELPAEVLDVETIYSQGLTRQSAGVVGAGTTPPPF